MLAKGQFNGPTGLLIELLRRVKCWLSGFLTGRSIGLLRSLEKIRGKTKKDTNKISDYKEKSLILEQYKQILHFDNQILG